ncbi:MAG: hypothetical protein AB8B65_01850 [Kordia sp.]|uniref:hypothetical protein n=1 Tax=Kordia sp. TaxID=1965332 RepID=UPI00385D2CAB
MKYQIIAIENTESQDRYTVSAKKVNSDDKVALKNIALPIFVRVGDLIRHCEHNFYDVIDSNDNLVYRN